MSFNVSACKDVYPGSYIPMNDITETIQHFNLLSPIEKIEPEIVVHKRQAMKEITIALPGFLKHEMSIFLQEHILWIRAYKADEDATKKYEARIKIPSHADVWFIEATYKDGLLTIKIPLEKEACSKISRDIIIY